MTSLPTNPSKSFVRRNPDIYGPLRPTATSTTTDHQLTKPTPPNAPESKPERKGKRPKSGYNSKVVVAYFVEQGLPAPELEYRFHPDRKWRFDFAWDGYWGMRANKWKWCTHPNANLVMVALEVDGGIWINGGHNRGAQIKKTWEKENEAQIMGWMILKVEPKDLCTEATVALIKRALGIQ